jgi:hypothetical protein
MSSVLPTETDVARQLRVSLACLRRWRLEKRGPIFVKIGHLVRYRAEDVDSWLQSLPTGGLGSLRRAAGSESENTSVRNRVTPG